MAVSTTKPPEYQTVSERQARGKAARTAVPRADHAAWVPASDRRDPVEILDEQAASRVSELIPIRYGRMLASPFTFYRGAAHIMAADLAGTPNCGILVNLCADVHLTHFCAYTA